MYYTTPVLYYFSEGEKQMTGQEREQHAAHEDGHTPKPHGKRGGASDRPTRNRDTED